MGSYDAGKEGELSNGPTIWAVNVVGELQVLADIHHFVFLNEVYRSTHICEPLVPIKDDKCLRGYSPVETQL